MTETRRRLFHTDEEDSQLYLVDGGDLSYYGGESALEDYGLDVSVDLVDKWEEAVRTWDEMEKALQEWFHGLYEPDKEGSTDNRYRFESTALHHNVTWSQYRARPTCDHADAIAELAENEEGRRTENAGGLRASPYVRCKPCGATVHYVKRKYIRANSLDALSEWIDLDPPYEVEVSD